MTDLTEHVMEKMVRVIVDTVNPEQIILFGSHAKGQARPHSDVDLLIVESDPFDAKRSRRKEMAKLWRVLASFPFGKDILVYSRDEIEHWRHSLNNVIARALREGRILYERPQSG